MLDKRNEPGWADMRYNRTNRCDCECNGVGQPNEGCCRGSNLRPPGIRRTSTRGVYFADADLRCSGVFCEGYDQDTIYEWSLFSISGNTRIVGDSRKIGNDRVEVAGSGAFELTVTVTFRCRTSDGRDTVDCVRTAIREFTQ
ncbi:hypothetical protein E2K98_25230 [Bacillus salipaludis]|uniref:Uncharacterized protein n=1 Tax=Bacillus salipaludis TaxID=2547811 RepID=A0A4R5VJL8_9BACI|nr:hypothetical protein [Bacillus salipaludis]MDQ6597789.1 hypothetical protein [Bacillus salipaludis]TDK57360.1 hypothetical protein E2K98_25230 [Bacillus salipaludis]